MEDHEAGAAILGIFGIVVIFSALFLLIGFLNGKEKGIQKGKEIGHYEVLQKKVIYELQQQPDSTVIWVRMK